MKIQSFCGSGSLLPVVALGLCASVTTPAMAITKITCVTDSNGLTNALASLNSSANNSDNDEIRIHVGTYFAPAQGWRGTVTSNHDLAIHGGYTDATCTQRSLDASFTALDGNDAITALRIDSKRPTA